MTPPSPHYWTNMLPSLLSSLNAPPNPTHGSLLLSIPSDPPFLVLKTSINALTLLFPFHPLRVTATAITNSSSHPKRSITPTSSLLPLIILAVSGKLSINYSIGNRHPSYLPLLHHRLSRTVLLLSLQTRFTKSAHPWRHLHCSFFSLTFITSNTSSVLFFQRCIQIRNIKDTS